MQQPIILVQSVTQAVRGQQVLAAQGIPSHIVRNAYHSATSGCGYGLAVNGSIPRARSILVRAGVRVIDREEV